MVSTFSYCICCGSNFSLVLNFSNQFNFCFSLSLIMVIDFRQRKVKIKLVWKILNQGKIWTTTYTCVALTAQFRFWLLCNYFLITHLCILSIDQNHHCLLLKLISSMHALTDFFLKRDAKEKACISRKMNASVRESEKTEIYDEIDWTKLIREMGYKICTYPISTCIWLEI